MLYRWTHDGVIAYRSTVLDELKIPHAFGTRHGDGHQIIKALGLNHQTLITVRQVHGRAVRVDQGVSTRRDTEPASDADAVVLARPTTATRIFTADCVPVLLATSDRRKVAAVHAGWRGCVAGVVEEAVASLGSPFVAAVGPCIGVEHFEVGDEVAEQFDERFIRRDLGPRPHIDLRAVVFSQLSRLGAAQIDTTDRCTLEHEADFFSHRRDVTHRGGAATGRMASVIGNV